LISKDIPAFISRVNSGIEGLPKIDSFEILPTVEETVGILPTSFKVTVGYSWAYLSPFTLNKECWIYLMVK